MVKPNVLLLESFEKDGIRIKSVLNWLQELKIISLHHDKKNALSFSATELEATSYPHIFLMYMNKTEISRIDFLENAYLLHTQSFLNYAERIKFNCHLHPVGGKEKLRILDFLKEISMSSRYLACVHN
ncbi:hypothetical protein [Halocola ammonii]